MNQRPSPSGSERRNEVRSGVVPRLRNVLFPVLRWIERHVQGFHTAVGLFLTIGFVIAVLALWAFAEIADLVTDGQTQRFDDSVLLWIHRHASPAFDVYALEITSLGSGTVVFMTILIASAFLWSSRHRYSVWLLWIAVAGGGLLNLALKALFDRPRPQLFEWRTPYAGQSSFPSGHSMYAVIVYWTLAYLLSRLEESRLMKRLTWAFAVIVILLIGLSRLYLGVHYPSDVLGGFIAGFAWATFCATGIEAVRYFRTRKPEVEEAEHDLDGKRPAASLSSAR